jgi:hypothetical protein
MKNILLLSILIVSIFLSTSCSGIEPNAYVVSSEFRSVPIIDDETGQTVGQAYDGFAVLLSEVRNGKTYFFMSISDPSLPQNIKRMEFYIPVEYMKKAYVEPQFVPAIISLDTIRINPMAGINIFRQGKQEVVARFYDEIGPMQFIQNVDNGYLFLLGMNLVHVGEQDVQLFKYVD